MRELKNVIRKAVLFCDGNALTAEMVSRCISDIKEEQGKETLPDLRSHGFPISMTEAEKITIRAALDHTKGNKTKAAGILQIAPNTLLKKIKIYGL